jgi:hypothetical protein
MRQLEEETRPRPVEVEGAAAPQAPDCCVNRKPEEQ